MPFINVFLLRIELRSLMPNRHDAQAPSEICEWLWERRRSRNWFFLQEKGARTCLAALPGYFCVTILSSQEFRDEIRDRYYLTMLQNHSHCDSCNAKHSVSHSLACKVSSLTRSRHGEIRGSLIFLASTGLIPLLLAMNN